MRDVRLEKKTNSTKKYHLLQHQNMATATKENKAQCEKATSKKKILMQPKKLLVARAKQGY
jgi:hypothetical protein